MSQVLHCLEIKRAILYPTPCPYRALKLQLLKSANIQFPSGSVGVQVLYMSVCHEWF